MKNTVLTKNTTRGIDATSADETKSMIFLKSGIVALSNMKATLLVKRANKNFSPEKEKGVEIPKIKNSKEENSTKQNDFTGIFED